MCILVSDTLDVVGICVLAAPLHIILSCYANYAIAIVSYCVIAENT